MLFLFLLIVLGFEYSKALNHALKSSTAVSGWQLIFFISKKSDQKSLVQKKAIASHRFIYNFTTLHIFAS